MNKKDIINNVKSYHIDNKYDLFYLNNKSEIIINNKLLIRLSNNFFGEFYLTNENIIIQKFKENSFEVYDKSGKLEFEKKGFYNYLITDKSIFYLDIKDNKVKYIVNGKIKATSFFYNGYLSNQNYIIIRNQNIFVYFLKDSRKLWQYNLIQLGKYINQQGSEDEYKVEKFIGVYENQLLVACNNFTIISLDLNNGKLLNKWQEIPEVYFQEDKRFPAIVFNKIPYLPGANLDIQKKQIIGFEAFVFWSINLETNEIISQNLNDELIKHNLKSVKFQTEISASDTHYIIKVETMVDQEASRFYDGIAAVNKETLEIEWKYIFDKNVFIGSNNPKLVGNILYQLDTNETLHVFEKED